MTFSKLGIDIDSNQLVNLPKAARTKGFYIIGLQGMGKSGLLENLIMEDINQQIGVCVLDPKRELIDNIIARLPNRQKEEQVIYLDLAEKDYFFGLNLFDCSDPTDDDEITKTVNQVTHVFEKAFGISMATTPRIYDYLFNIAYTLIANPGYTMIDIPLVFNPACRQKLLGNVPSGDVVKFRDDIKQLPQQEQHSQAREILRRLNDFSHFPLRFIVGQSRSTIDLQKIMDERKILLVKLDRTKEQATSLIGSIIVALILKASASRQTKRPQFHLYADEFQRFATEDFATLLEEARYADIGITMAHQNRAQLELSDKQADANLKTRTLNVGNIVVFRVPTDAEELAVQFDTTPPSPTPEEKTRRAIQTPVSKPIDWLLSGKTHTNPMVNQFVMKYNSYAYYFTNNWDIWNDLLYQVMRENNPNLAIPTNSYEFFMGRHERYYVYKVSYAEQKIISPLCASLDVRQTIKYLTPIFNQFYQDLYSQVVKIYELKKRTAEQPYHSQADTEFIRPYDTRFPLDGQVNSAVERVNNGINQWLQFLIDLREVMHILAVEPIEEDSGRQEIVMGHGVQLSSAEMEARISNQLLHLQKFTAWVKISEAFPQNPGKKCLKCGKLNKYGAVYCGGCGTRLPAPNEYIITTLQPNQGIGKTALQQRITAIQARNVRERLLRKRADVEAEITQRQASCSGGSAPAQPQPKQPSPQPQPRHARQVPVQGKCPNPNCGAVNSSNAKFCNQCGTKLH